MPKEANMPRGAGELGARDARKSGAGFQGAVGRGDGGTGARRVHGASAPEPGSGDGMSPAAAARADDRRDPSAARSGCRVLIDCLAAALVLAACAARVEAAPGRGTKPPAQPAVAGIPARA